jgi:hypothetical protein
LLCCLSISCLPFLYISGVCWFFSSPLGHCPVLQSRMLYCSLCMLCCWDSLHNLVACFNWFLA